jgi:hypothetical protein
VQPNESTARESRAGWTGLSRDITVIFLGALLAIAVNRQWQGQQDREREHAELEQILATTRENESRLAQAIRQDSLSHAVAQQTVERLSAAGPAPTLDSLRALLPRAFGLSDWRPLTGAYSALVHAGNLRVIRNVRLRGQIATYASEVETTSDKLGRMEPMAFQSKTQIDRWLPAERVDSSSRSSTAIPAEEQRLATAFGRNEEVRQLLRGERSVAGNRVTLLKALRTETAALRQALERELNVTSAAPTASDQVKI